MEDRVIRLQQRARAEAAVPQRDPSRADVVRLLDRHPPAGIDLDDKCRCGDCRRIVERQLFDPFNFGQFEILERALKAGKTRRVALFELRDDLMRLPEVREMLADTSIARSVIIAGVNARAADVAFRVCYPEPVPKRPKCGVSKTLNYGTRAA